MKQHIRRWLPTAAFVVGLAIAAFALVAASAPRPLKDADVAAAKHVVRDAIADTLDVGTFKDPDWKAGKLDKAAKAVLHAEVHPKLVKHLGGKALDLWETAINESVDRDSDGEHLITTGGGVNKLTFTSVEPGAGGAIVVTGRAQVFSTWKINKADWKGDRAGRAENWINFTATVAMGSSPVVTGLDMPLEQAP